MKNHEFVSEIVWTGNRGTGTATYKGYDRTWSIVTPSKPRIDCSNDPLLGGDKFLHNPEDLLLSTVAACHMLWYLHLASSAGITVVSYTDSPLGVAASTPDGAGQFVEVILRPLISVAPGTDTELADAIHGRIHEVCFIARSVNFPVRYEARYEHTAHRV